MEGDTARLEFQQGVLFRVTVSRSLPDGQLNKTYQDLDATFRRTYGEPQIPPGPLSVACATSLADCLKNGEKVKGPAWHWATGSLEFQPIWRDGGAVLEERFTHEDAGPP